MSIILGLEFVITVVGTALPLIWDVGLVVEGLEIGV